MQHLCAAWDLSWYCQKGESPNRSRAVGFSFRIKKRQPKKYKEGRTTLSQASKEAELSLWDFQQYLMAKGYVSSYSIEDLQEELETIQT